MGRIDYKLSEKGRLRITRVLKQLNTDKLMIFCSSDRITIFKKDDCFRFKKHLEGLGIDPIVINGEINDLKIDSNKRISIGVNEYARKIKRDATIVGVYFSKDNSDEGFEKYEFMSEEEYNKKVEKSEEILSKSREQK